MVRYGFILLILFIPFDLLAQSFTPNPDWRFNNFNSQNHFISRDIVSLTMDKYGYMWTCSRGVQRFDGYKTIDFNSLDAAKGGLRGNYTDVITDNGGRVWVSSEGLCYYDNASGKFVYIQPGAGRKLTYVQAFFVQNNYLWFVCDYGLAKLDLTSLKIIFTALTNVADPLCTNMIDENTLLISSRDKVYIYNIGKNTYSANTLIYNHTLVKIFAIARRGEDIFLATTNGLFTLKNLKDISPVEGVAKDGLINDILFLPGDKEQKYLFLATEGKGLMVYNTILKKIEFTYLHNDNNLYSLANNTVSKFYADKNGRLWIATALGMSMLDAHNQQWKMRFLNKDNTGDLYINKIARDKYDSVKVWMSSYSRGMICVDWQTKKVEKLFDTDPRMQKIYDFVQLSKDKWLVATQKEIMEWGPETGVLLQKKLPVADSLALVYNIRGLIQTDANTCFITTNHGLFRYDLVKHAINVVSESKLSKKIADLKYDLQNGFYDHGILWIASRNGLFSYEIAKQATTIYRGQGRSPDYYLFNIVDAPGNQVVCAAGNGITIFNKQTKSFKVINKIANLNNPDCESVISINNRIWIGTEDGILNYDLRTGKSARDEHETGSVQIFPSSSFTGIGNDIVLGFRNGFAYFTPDIKNILSPSNPVIERVYVNNQPVLQQYPNQKNGGRFVLKHSENSINVIFTAFLYNDPDHINFRYRLKGADTMWQYTQGQRSANYAQLPPGSYTFYVQCGNKNGVWNDHLASFDFMIQPPYWETWWFRAAVVIIIALALYRLYRYRIKNILAIQKIRERIASDFHDDIGTALSSISIFSEVADTQLEEELPREQTREIIGHISFHSRAMLDAMDDIIWAVNPQNDHFYDLAVRMREFAIPLLEARNIQFDIEIQEDILNTRIKMEARKNVFLIFKECINNILKHANCSVMKVSVKKINDQLELVISDNGKGFDLDAPNTRNGLKNMQKRAAEINGIIKVTTRPGDGTMTMLTVNIV